MSVEPIRWTGDSLELLNQLRLPREVVYVTCRTSHEVAEAIKSMVVRGAPAIG
ncbi:MAG TPA: S-methyl-5-thioribose-1-phosphate isomerase, partial [Thermoanaerobaculia bacterium]